MLIHLNLTIRTHQDTTRNRDPKEWCTEGRYIISLSPNDLTRYGRGFRIQERNLYLVAKTRVHVLSVCLRIHRCLFESHFCSVNRQQESSWRNRSSATLVQPPRQDSTAPMWDCMTCNRNLIGVVYKPFWFLEEIINTRSHTHIHFTSNPWLLNPAKSKASPPSWLNSTTRRFVHFKIIVSFFFSDTIWSCCRSRRKQTNLPDQPHLVPIQPVNIPNGHPAVTTGLLTIKPIAGPTNGYPDIKHLVTVHGPFLQSL